MREKLADHIGEYVLCRGWIGGWEDMDKCSTRRLYIKQPTIKRANKDLLYAEQETISTEHHLNLFIKYEDLPDYDTTFELNQPIHFTGEVEEYTRADGTTDFGIYGTKQSTISFKLERIIKSVQETLDKPVEGIDLTYLKGHSHAWMNWIRSWRSVLTACPPSKRPTRNTRQRWVRWVGASHTPSSAQRS